MKINYQVALNLSEEYYELQIKKLTFQNNEFLQILAQSENYPSAISSSSINN